MFGQVNANAGRIQIKRFFLFETGTYNPQYRRPYETALTGHTLNQIDERMANTHKYSASLFSGIAGQFLRPQAAPESDVPIFIPHGWNERRMRFMMEVEYHHPLTDQMTLILTGYTDQPGATVSGAIDERMPFYINGVIMMRNSVVPTPLGMQQYSAVSETSQVLVQNHNWAGITAPVKEERLRPTDVYSAIQRNHIPDIGKKVFDTRTTVTDRAVKSRRANNVPSNYTASMLENYKNATLQHQDFGSTPDDVLNEARGLSNESMVTEDPFMTAISNLRGNVPANNTFTYAELRMLDPNVDFVKHVMMLGQMNLTEVHHAGQTAEWHVAEENTAGAAFLSQAVPALMADVALTRMSFTATNRDFGVNVMPGVPTKITIKDFDGFGTSDHVAAAQVFENRLTHEILKDLSFNDMKDYWVEMNVDLLGETRVRISLNGGPYYDFCTPSFCDALLVPVITTNYDKAGGIANDFERIFEHLQGHVGGPVNQPNFGRI